MQNQVVKMLCVLGKDEQDIASLKTFWDRYQELGTDILSENPEEFDRDS